MECLRILQRQKNECVKQAEGVYSSSCEPISELQGVTFHMGSHSVTCHPTEVNVPRLKKQCRPVLELPIPETWKAELTWVIIYRDGLHVRRPSPIQVVTIFNSNPTRSQIYDLLIVSPMPYHYVGSYDGLYKITLSIENYGWNSADVAALYTCVCIMCRRQQQRMMMRRKMRSLKNRQKIHFRTYQKGIN